MMKIVDDVFEEMDVNDIIEEMSGESDEDGHYLMIAIALVIAVKTSQKLAKKL